MNKVIKNILVIDDDPDICAVTKLILRKAGYNAIAMDHFEPFSKSNEPDAIILDISLPQQDGRKICKQLKANKETRHIPVILFSANPDTKKAAIEAGADDSLEKPFELNELVQKVKNLPTFPQNGEKIPQNR